MFHVALSEGRCPEQSYQASKMFEDNGLLHAASPLPGYSASLPREALRLCCDILRLLCSMLQRVTSLTCCVPQQSLLLECHLEHMA